MEIRHLSLRNIRSYERAELDLPSGTTLIAGDVGAGKTSLLYAIEMALFGFAAVDAPFLIRHGAVHAEVSVTLAGGGHTYEVGRRFRRVNRKGKDSFEIERLTYAQDGVRTVYSATELRQRVIDLFGFPDNPNPRSHSDLWRWAVYVPQERMREVLSQEPHERLETVRRALGVERYRLAAENAQDAAAEIRQLARFRQDESDRLSHWESELVERGAELDRAEVLSVELARSETQIEAGLSAARKAAAAADAAVHSAEGDRRELDGLEREQTRDHDQALEALRARDAITAEIAAAPPRPSKTPDELDRLLRGLEEEARALESGRRALTKARETTEAGVRQLIQARTEAEARERAVAEARRLHAMASEEAALALVEAERARREGPAKEPPEPTPRTLPQIEAALEAARRDERSAADREVRARAELEQVEQLLAAGECPRCHQSVRPEDFGRHRGEAASALAAAAAVSALAGKAVTHLEEERRSRERFERARERWQEADRRRRAAEDHATAQSERQRETGASLAQVEQALREATERVERFAPVLLAEGKVAEESRRMDSRQQELSGRLDRARAERQAEQEARLRREALLKEQERRSDDIDRLNGRLREREAQIRSLGSRTARLSELVEEANRARRSEEELSKRSEELRLRSARTEQDAHNARLRRKEAEDGVAERTRLRIEVRDLEAKASWLAVLFREALLAMEQRILAQAQAAFQRDFGRFFRALIDDPLLEARVGAGFDPTVLIEGAWTPAEALSGGERTALALAFRLALGRVVRTMGSLKLDTMFLDEPTDGFSPEQVVRMGELLRGLELPQLVLVSHESQLSAVADHVTLAVKEHGRSEIHAVGRPASPPTETPEPARETEAPLARRKGRTARRTRADPP